jgi:hypothetical protein
MVMIVFIDLLYANRTPIILLVNPFEQLSARSDRHG